MQEIQWLDELFLSTEMWGYFGVIGVVILGIFIAKKESFAGIMWFVLECLMAWHYYQLLAVTPEFYWQFYILVLGGICTCLLSLRG